MTLQERFSLTKPTFIIGAGLSAVGKTTLLHGLTRALVHGYYIDKDEIAGAFMCEFDEGAEKLVELNFTTISRSTRRVIRGLIPCLG